MLNRVGWIVWALAPVVLLTWWFGPGEVSRAKDAAAAQIVLARNAQAMEDWQAAADHYTQALAALPESDVEAHRRLRLEQGRATIYAGKLWEGIDALEALLDEAEGAKSELAEPTRHELATARYYAAWLMRLEGAEAELWKPETEQARQHFRLLAERAEAEGEDAESLKKNVEAVIRLEQMDLAELEALPLPKNCPNCSNCSGEKKSRCSGQGQCKGQGQGDGRKKIISTGAGAARAQGAGS